MGGVSVIIPVHNARQEWLAEAIMSAVEQNPKPLEVIVIDDGSTVPVSSNHPLVRVIRQDNAGVASARNTGVFEAAGEYVAFLDQDDRWRPGKLAAQLQLMAHPAIGLSSTDSFIIGPDGAPRPGFGHGAESYAQLLQGNGICASSVLARRSVLVGVGGFPERLSGVDDWETWLRVARVSELRHEPQVLVDYRQHGENASRHYDRMWCRSMLVLWRHRRQRPWRGARRMNVIFGSQAFDQFRSTRSPRALVWAVILWPDHVLPSILRWVFHRNQRPKAAVR